MLEQISISCFAHFWYGWLCKKQISMTVILSQPSPPIEESEARHLVMSSSQISSGSNPCANRWMTKSATSWLLNTSQIPSHAKTTNCRSSVISRTTTSGSGEMICFSAASSGLVLKAKSPKARLRAKFPLTRLNSTNPPAWKYLKVCFCNNLFFTDNIEKNSTPTYLFYSIFLFDIWRLVVGAKCLCNSTVTRNTTTIANISNVQFVVSVSSFIWSIKIWSKTQYPQIMQCYHINVKCTLDTFL